MQFQLLLRFMASHNTLRQDKGFTITEILIVIALMSVLLSFTCWIGVDSYRRYLFRNERDTIVNVLQKARNQAMSNICMGSACVSGKSHGVHLEDSKYIIFQGSDYTTRDISQDEEIVPNYNLSFSGSTIIDVVFEGLSGDVLGSGEIKLSDYAGKTSDININSEGRISWTN